MQLDGKATTGSGMENPDGRDVAGQLFTEGNVSKPRGKRLSRWLRKGIGAVGEKVGNERVVSTLVNGRQPTTRFPYSSRSLKDHEIRLVHLQPRTASEGMIQCILVIVNLNDTPQYEALSYEWGPALPELPVIMGETSIPIRENLWWALHHLQLENEPRVLWIDALCINQQSTAERNHQVAQMGNIYSSATRCIAWIGRERIIHESTFQVDDCELALAFIKKSQTSEDREDYSKGLSPHCRQEHDSLEFLCRRKYWSRLWIIQEILLSLDVVVQWSAHEVSWQALSTVFNNLKTSVHASYQFSISSSAPFRLNQQSNARRDSNAGTNGILSPPLADLVLQFKGSQCEDPRDTVFGLLSLARVCCREAVPADYSTSPEQICTTLLIHHIMSHLDLTDKSPDTTADIQELCETILFKSKVGYVSRLDDTSIASASMKAVHTVRPRNGPVPAGRVIWVVAVLKLKNAFGKSQTADLGRPARAAPMPRPAVSLGDQPKHHLSSQTPSETEKESEDVFDIFTNQVDLNQVDLEHPAYCDLARVWIERRDSLRKNPESFKFLFLTDMGYSGVSVFEVELGTIAHKRSNEFDWRINFNDESLFSRRSDRWGICLDSRRSFQELLCWVR